MQVSEATAVGAGSPLKTDTKAPTEVSHPGQVHPDEELFDRLRVNPHRILVPTALDRGSALALEYASTLALRLNAEVTLLYVLENRACPQASRVEAELRRCFAALQGRHLKVRLFLRAGLVCEQVKAVAEALGTDLIVTSRDYHDRFLSWLVHENANGPKVQGVPCPIALVDPPMSSEPCRKETYPALVPPSGRRRAERHRVMAQTRRRVGRSVRRLALGVRRNPSILPPWFAVAPWRCVRSVRRDSP